MSSSLVFDTALGIVRATLAGAVTVEAFIEVLSEVIAEPSIPVTADILWDLSRCDFSKFDFDFFNELVEKRVQLDLIRGENLAAVVVGSEEDKRLAHVMKALSDARLSQHMEIFMKLREAEEWLLLERRRRTR